MLCLPLKAYAEKNDKWDQYRILFVKAEKALAKKNYTEFKNLKAKLIHYPLYPYLEYADLENRIHTATPQEFKNFLEKFSDSPLVPQLRKLWLNTKGKQENWEEYLYAYLPTQDLGLQCQYLWATYQAYKNKSIFDKVLPLWMTGKPHPKACEILFTAWQEEGYLTKPLVWQRIQLAIQHENEPAARKLSLYLKKSEQALVDLWLYIHNNPEMISNEKYFRGKHPALLEILVHGVSRIAKKNPELAVKLWPIIAKTYPFTEKHWGHVVRAIGLSFAFQRHPDAEKWLEKVPVEFSNTAVHEWRIRAAITKNNWPGVLKWTNLLPNDLSNEAQWKYWKARAHEMLQEQESSQEILQQLTTERNYYGFLASHKLLKPYALSYNKIVISTKALFSVAKRIGIRRAREWHILGRDNKGKEEWRLATQLLSDTERQAAAKLALDWGLPNWAIVALANSKDKNAIQLRFPVLHSKYILTAAEVNQIDPAWIFAVTRQESAFMPNARSAAGALGLMQLMPSTAQMIAKQQKLNLKHDNDIMHIDKNIRLGSRYLRMMLNEHQSNPVLATAAYNAGPGRVKRWLPEFSMQADAWIESIPYKETRDYVKNVLTYTVIYQQILGKQPGLQQHMPNIEAQIPL